MTAVGIGVLVIVSAGLALYAMYLLVGQGRRR